MDHHSTDGLPPFSVTGVLLNLLVLEDRPADAELLVRALKTAPFDVTWTRVETEQAFRDALTDKPDLILADYNLPQFDAIRALDILQESNLEIPFILVSGAVGEESAVELMKRGMDDFLLKDRLARLPVAVTQALRSHYARQQRRSLEAEQKRLLHDLRERVKELSALQQVSRLLDNDSLLESEVLQQIANLLPGGMQHSALAGARVSVGDGHYVSDGFTESEFQLTRNIAVPAGGSITIAYRERPTTAGEPKFLEEERQLLDTVAEMLHKWLQRRHGQREMARAALMLANVRDAIVVTDPDGIVTYWNDQATRLFGWTADEMTGRPLESRYHEADRRERIRAVRKHLLTGEEWSSEFVDLCKDGSTIWVDSRVTPVLDNHGQTTGFLGISRDVSERKQNEIALRRAQTELQSLNEHLEATVRERTHELKEREAFNRATLDTLSAHIAVLDSTGRVMTTNQAWKDFARANGGTLAPEDEPANYLEVCDASAGQGSIDARRTAQAIRRILAGELDDWSHEYPCRTPAEELWFLLRARPVVINGERHVLLAHENITQMKHTEENLRDALETAEQANRAKSTFLTTMSHELRTPLNGILGMNELLLTTGLDERQREYVAASEESGKHLLTLINDVLDLSRIEAGKLELKPGRCDLVNLVECMVATFAPLAREKGLEFQHQIGTDVPPTIHCDRHRLQQVLINLLGNALKFTDEGGIRVGLQSIEGGTGDARVRFTVSDTGIGIPAERVDCLFKAFSQIDSSTSRRYGGSGLGLSICRELVHLMGGRIGVDSEDGAGSTFWFEIPAKRSEILECETMDCETVACGTMEFDIVERGTMEFDTVERGTMACERVEARSVSSRG